LREVWFKFLLRLTIAQKNQDAAWLWYLGVHGKTEYAHPEFTIMRNIAGRIPNDEPAKMPTIVLDKILKESISRELTDYEIQACKAVEARRLSGGMKSDQWNAISAQLLIHMRGLPESEVLDMLENQKQLFRDEKISTLQEIPWFCFDMHTRPGQMAMRVWLKNYKTKLFSDEDRLVTAWFQLESAMVGAKVLSDFSSIVENPTWKLTQWHQAKLQSLADWYGVTVAEMREHWKEVMPKVKDLVQWAIKKSEN